MLELDPGHQLVEANSVVLSLQEVVFKAERLVGAGQKADEVLELLLMESLPDLHFQSSVAVYLLNVIGVNLPVFILQECQQPHIVFTLFVNFVVYWPLSHVLVQWVGVLVGLVNGVHGDLVWPLEGKVFEVSNAVGKGAVESS